MFYILFVKNRHIKKSRCINQNFNHQVPKPPWPHWNFMNNQYSWLFITISIFYTSNIWRKIKLLINENWQKMNLKSLILTHDKSRSLCYNLLPCCTCSLTRSSWQRAQEQVPCLLTVRVGAAMWVFLAVVGLEDRRYRQGCLTENTPLKGGKSSNQENRDPKYPVVLH